MEVPELSQSSARQRAPEEPQEIQAVEAITAFIVLVTPDGQILAAPDIHTPMNVSRQPSLDEIGMMCNQIHRNLEISKIAQSAADITVSTMMQAGQQAVEAQRNAQVQAAIARGTVRPPGA